MFYWILIIFTVILLPLFEQVRPVDKRWLRAGSARLPPGPQGMPLLGNLLQFRKARNSGLVSSYLLSLAQYGELTTMHMGSHLWVLINTDQVANDVIGKKSMITSERPHMPVASGLFWCSYWEALGHSHREVFREWSNPIKLGAREKKVNASWVRDAVLNPDTKYNGGDEEATFLTNSVISAGGDDSRMVLNTFVMASICFPEQFQNCRQEIDQICGLQPGRLLVPEDVASMSYVCGFIKEVLRWRPIVPMIPLHQLTEVLTYRGYVFLKGTNFLINTVAVCADCDDPDEVRPSRWLDGHEASLTRGFWGFGGGRKICIGYKAEQPALFLAISRLIYCFDFNAGGPLNSRQFNHTSSKEPSPVVASIRNEMAEILIKREGRARGLCS